MNNISNRRMPHAIFASERSQAVSCGVPAANLSHVGIYEGCLVVLGTGFGLEHITATLRPHIGKVVGLGAKEQMIETHTAGIVATVTELLCGIAAVGQKPRDAMGALHASAYADLTVPVSA